MKQELARYRKGKSDFDGGVYLVSRCVVSVSLAALVAEPRAMRCVPLRCCCNLGAWTAWTA